MSNIVLKNLNLLLDSHLLVYVVVNWNIGKYQLSLEVLIQTLSEDSIVTNITDLHIPLLDVYCSRLKENLSPLI